MCKVSVRRIHHPTSYELRDGVFLSYEDNCIISRDGVHGSAIFIPFHMPIQSNVVVNVSDLGHLPTKRRAAFNNNRARMLPPTPHCVRAGNSKVCSTCP